MSKLKQNIQENGGFQHWFVNVFWYHYKWPLLIGVVVLGIIVFITVDSLRKERYDTTVVIATDYFVDEEQLDALDEVLKPVVVQTWLGCIIAASVIAFPLMYRNARAAFEQVDPDLIYAARTLGMKERTIFWRVVMPAAGPGVASGTVLTFARALGEYGATAMLAGNIAGKTGTISQKIANVIKDGDYATAGVWVVIMLVIALVIIMVINYLSGGKNRKQNRW